MRRAASKAIRVGPGDEVTVKGRLPGNAKLGRLYVFAKGKEDERFYPYVQDVPAKLALNGALQMYTPTTMRLTTTSPASELTLIADLDGWLQVMQEVDTAQDPAAKIRLSRKICQHLPWQQKLTRKLSRFLPWI